MKTLSIFSIFAAAAMLAQAAPVIEQSDLSEETLLREGFATERQRESFERYRKARAEAERQREEAAREAQRVTERNDAGMRRTIQRRALNTMLPACDREPETPREPGNYRVRY